MKNGRQPIKAFAEYLGIGQSYVAMLMSGKRDNVSQGTAYMICDRLQNYELLDILGYSRIDTSPDDFPKALLPTWKYIQEDKRKQIRELWREALEESDVSQETIDQIDQFLKANKAWTMQLFAFDFDGLW